MEEKETIIMSMNALSCLDFMSNEQAGELFKMIRDYNSGKSVSSDDNSVRMAFTFLKNQFEKSAKRRERCIANGKKGGAPKGNKNARKTKETFDQTYEHSAKLSNIQQEQEKDSQENNPKQPKNNQETTKDNPNQPKSTLLGYNIDIITNKVDNKLSTVKDNIVSKDTRTTDVAPSSTEESLFENDNSVKSVYDIILDMWNQRCGGKGLIPSVRSLNEDRKRRVKLRLKNLGDNYMLALQEVFDKIANSTFLRGESTGRKWCATFDWVFSNDTNIQKILDGNYDSKQDTSTQETIKTKRFTSWN